ncbi:DUF2141 domain-containing protein [Aquimarina hainanensis]|uniref:DUF2141 domain-containing protein n=1 Tax=Aquimarina hainanensis TaxID=1578017 RepID=A0ABW5NAM7_9FLAO|nr:DUF2141 domain-containing protein [Aquimarina sp. TRL1]QKX07111.1 DUF2141 domain-containing protein [Aquimarina sp. TRL1]
MKQKIITLIVVVFAAILSGQAQEQTYTIEVTINNIASDDGSIKIGLCDKKKDFLKKFIKGKSIKAQKGSMTVSFEEIPKGTYAISLIHDEDDNGKLNTFLMIPSEPYGTSNNAKGNFGPPKWQDAKFDIIDKDIKLSIDL